jgi:hypothetical protein
VTEAIHDFTAKLRQPSVRAHLESYVRWRKDLARARAAGEPDPAPPPIAPISINLDLTTACNYRCDHCIDWDKYCIDSHIFQLHRSKYSCLRHLTEEFPLDQEVGYIS